MEKTQALKERISSHPMMKKENLNLKTWMNVENVKGLRDFVLQRDSDAEVDGHGFDEEDMLLESDKCYMEAAKKNDVETMKRLTRGVNVNATNVHGRTALHYAVARKNHEAVSLLLQRRVKLDLQDKHGVTATHLAALFGSLDVLKLLIQGGADQKIETNEGMNIMHCAAVKNHTEIVRYIVNDLHMKELDKEDETGKRAFSLAAEHGCVAMLELLQEEPFNMATMQEDLEGNNPLHLAAKNGHLQVIRLLLQSFEHRNEVNKAGETPLYLATDLAFEECVLELLEGGCDPNIVTTVKRSPLHPACEKGYTSLVKLLISNGADINLQDRHLQAPFHLAVKHCHFPLIHTLLEAGCNVNITDHRGQTALHVAAELGKVDVVEMILKAGADLTVQDRQAKTVLGVAARANMVIIVDMVIKAERYFEWKKANVECDETLHNDCPLTFKLDHRVETKSVRTTVWNLAYNIFKPGDWKKLGHHWAFTEPQTAAIEEQWTGPKSYREHGNRMMLIWLHGVCMAGKNAIKELYESLHAVGYTSVADKIRAADTGAEAMKCNVS